MKKISLLFVLTIFICTNVSARTCDLTLGSSCPSAEGSYNISASGCNIRPNDSEMIQYGCIEAKPNSINESPIYYNFETCIECKPGYTEYRGAEHIKVNGGQAELNCDNTYILNYLTCECICAEPCNGHGWRDVPGTGYQDFVTNSCLCDINGANCNPKTQYRCAAGYYGKPTTNTEPICNKCPDMPTDANMQVKNPGLSDLGNNEDITDCYQPSNEVFEDDVGKYTFADKCNNTGK